jgi:DNA-binding winged helix-turn-helix (wHTH) protein/tetratricopeptide (TPR) repeat protein
LIYRFGSFELDTRSAELRKNGIKLRIQEQSYHVLLKLLEHSSEIVSREELRAAIWPADTFVDFETGLNTVIKRLRETLGDSADTPKFIETIPRRGYRFVAPVEAQPHGAPTAGLNERVRPRPRSAYAFWSLIVLAIFVLSLLVTHYLPKPRSRHLLTEKDTIVVADFTNTTGDPVFDGTLKQALWVGLQQSPFLSLLSDQRSKDTVRLMGRSPGERLNEETAREVCQRTGSAAVLVGSISSLGTEYVLGLKAVNCTSGDPLTVEQEEAAKKEEVLKALDRAITKLRAKIGESLSTVQRYDTPLADATTPSLEALKAYSFGLRVLDEKGAVAAIPFFKRAIDLDPNFALAYAELAGIYEELLLEPGLATESIRKAYELRDHVSEAERFSITTGYYMAVTGELEKAAQECELWAQAYPRDPSPHLIWAGVNEYLGQYEMAALREREAIRLLGDITIAYTGLMEDEIALNHLDEAKIAYQEAIERKLDDSFLHDDMYALAFLQDNAEEMKSQLSWAASKPGAEDLLLSAQSDTEALYGHLGRARALSRQAVDSARRADLKETAALWQLNSALREAEFGNSKSARQATKEGLAIASTRNVRILAALTLARAGDIVPAEKMAAELERENPLNTAINRYWLPTIRAYIAIGQRHPALAVKILEAATPYDLAFPQPQFEEGGLLYPAYVRGKAYLLLHRGKEAAIEFQKLLNHRGVVINSPLGALARLGIAEAYMVQDDAARARAAFQDFLTLWRDADPNIPILQQAKAEYAKIQ